MRIPQAGRIEQVNNDVSGIRIAGDLFNRAIESATGVLDTKTKQSTDDAMRSLLGARDSNELERALQENVGGNFIDQNVLNQFATEQRGIFDAREFRDNEVLRSQDNFQLTHDADRADAVTDNLYRMSKAADLGIFRKAQLEDKDRRTNIAERGLEHTKDMGRGRLLEIEAKKAHNLEVAGLNVPQMLRDNMSNENNFMVEGKVDSRGYKIANDDAVLNIAMANLNSDGTINIPRALKGISANTDFIPVVVEQVLKRINDRNPNPVATITQGLAQTGGGFIPGSRGIIEENLASNLTNPVQSLISAQNRESDLRRPPKDGLETFITNSVQESEREAVHRVLLNATNVKGNDLTINEINHLIGETLNIRNVFWDTVDETAGSATAKEMFPK